MHIVLGASLMTRVTIGLSSNAEAQVAPMQIPGMMKLQTLEAGIQRFLLGASLRGRQLYTPLTSAIALCAGQSVRAHWVTEASFENSIPACDE